MRRYLRLFSLIILLGSAIACDEKLSDIAGPSTPDLEPTFASIQRNVFETPESGGRKNCTACHDSGVYTRKNRTVQSLSALQQQLDDCGHATQKTFSADERQNIVRYLNETYGGV